MPLIRTLPPRDPDASPELTEAYKAVGLTQPGRAHVYEIQSLHPGAMRGHSALYEAVMFGPSPLSREERETVAVVVSAVNDCFY